MSVKGAHIQHYGMQAKKPAHILFPIIASKLLRQASGQSASRSSFEEIIEIYMPAFWPACHNAGCCLHLLHSDIPDIFSHFSPECKGLWTMTNRYTYIQQPWNSHTGPHDLLVSFRFMKNQIGTDELVKYLTLTSGMPAAIYGPLVKYTCKKAHTAPDNSKIRNLQLIN